MREPELAAAVRNDDLAAVEVSCKHEVEDAGRELVDHAREVAEQDAEVGIRVGEPAGRAAALVYERGSTPTTCTVGLAELDAFALVARGASSSRSVTHSGARTDRA